MDWLAPAYTAQPLLFWILGSVALGVLGANVAWLVRRNGLQGFPDGQTIGQVVQFLFFLGIPYLVLGGWPRRPFQGLLSLEDFGLAGLSTRWPATRWLTAVGTASTLGLAALLLLILAWANASKAGGFAWLRFPPSPWWAVLAEVIYLQVHWAFYLSGLAVILGDWGSAIFLGLALIYLEWILNPFWRHAWHSEAVAASTWLRAALALVMAVLFLLTHNLWVCLSVQLLLELALRRIAPALSVAGTR